MESKVGRMGSGFYTLFDRDNTRLAYLWQRSLFTDMPNTPPRQRLEIYELWGEAKWAEYLKGCQTSAESFERFKELVAAGDIRLRRLNKSPSGRMHAMLYDPEQIVLDAPSASESETVEIEGVPFPKSMAWSGLVVKERVYGPKPDQ